MDKDPALTELTDDTQINKQETLREKGSKDKVKGVRKRFLKGRPGRPPRKGDLPAENPGMTRSLLSKERGEHSRQK